MKQLGRLDLNLALPIPTLTHLKIETSQPFFDNLLWLNTYGANLYQRLYQNRAWLIPQDQRECIYQVCELGNFYALFLL